MLYKNLILTFVVALASCKQVQQAKNLSNCEFVYAGIIKTDVSGIRLDNREGASDFSFFEVTKLLGALGSGDLPLTTNVLVNIKNNSGKVAALNKIEWEAFIGDSKITTGTLENRIEVGSGVQKQISIPVSANIAQLFSGDSRNEILNFVEGLIGDSDETPSIKLKVKPFFKIGKSYVAYPGFITVEQDEK